MVSNSAIERLNNQRSIVEVQARNPVLSRILESRKHMNKKVESLLNYDNVIRKASDKNVIGEMGGYWRLNGNSVQLYESGKALLTYVNGIPRYAFKHGKIPEDAYPWHSHPYSQGWWPSTENLVSVRGSEHRPHIIFTKLCVWVFRKSGNKKLRLDTNYSTLFNDFNTDIYSKTSDLIRAKNQYKFNKIFDWTVKGIMTYWKPLFENFGIHITFFRTCEKDTLVNYLKRDIETG